MIKNNFKMTGNIFLNYNTDYLKKSVHRGPLGFIFYIKKTIKLYIWHQVGK